MANKITTFGLLLILNLSTKSSNVFAKNIPSVVTAVTNNSIAKLSDETNPPQCPSEIYCYGPLLHTVQMAKIYQDSKTFVDMSLKDTPDNTMKKFNEFMETYNQEPTPEQVLDFVKSSFSDRGSEFQPFTPPDWKENPRFLDLIKDPALRQWGADLNSLWHILGRKMIDDVKENPDKYSIIYVPNHVIVPGGRFLEFYYWDSYWIVRGLLYSEMYATAKGMLENFLHIVNTFGLIPNGGRIYYSGRSQPPLLTGMVKSYVDFSKDFEFAVRNVDVLEKEFNYWMENHMIEVDGHKLYRYIEKTTGPRPESYREDVETAEEYKTNEEKENCYSELKAAAESGMDFSSRWFIDENGTNEGGLKHLKTRSIIPVELNAILYWNARLIAEFYLLAKNSVKAKEFDDKAQEIYEAVQAVLWNQEDGIWYDYDTINKKPRKYFVPTNLAPLWTKCFDLTKSQEISDSVVEYLVNKTKVDEYPGGVPNTLNPTGEQWDFPNVWPPMQYILIKALENLNTEESKALAEKWATRWVTSNFKAYMDENGRHMYEKYNAEQFGGHGGGGEYEVQLGFGWSNGVDIEFLVQYGNKISNSN
ncbi:TREH family protein [Megaselia abdita]